MNPKRQLLFLNLYNVLFSLRIADGVWVVFLLARGFSLVEVGLAQSVYSLISFVGEIPSGMAADLLGRKRTLAAAGLCGVLASLLMGFSQNLFGICVSMAFQALMFNLRSGTQQALAYDTLKAVGREREYPRANAILRVVSRVSASLSSLLGGFATLLGYLPAYLLNALSGVACGACTLGLKEPQVTEAQRQQNQHPFAGLGSRLKEHLRSSIRFFPRAACRRAEAAGQRCRGGARLSFGHIFAAVPAGWRSSQRLSGRRADASQSFQHRRDAAGSPPENAAFPAGAGLWTGLRGSHPAGRSLLVAPGSSRRLWRPDPLQPAGPAC